METVWINWREIIWQLTKNERAKYRNKLKGGTYLQNLLPQLFLLIILVSIYFEFVTIEQAFYIGLLSFSVTAVVWWYWTIYNIRYLVGLLSRASKKLLDVSKDLSEAKKELLDIEYK